MIGYRDYIFSSCGALINEVLLIYAISIKSVIKWLQAQMSIFSHKVDFFGLYVVFA